MIEYTNSVEDALGVEVVENIRKSVMEPQCDRTEEPKKITQHPEEPKPQINIQQNIPQPKPDPLPQQKRDRKSKIIKENGSSSDNENTARSSSEEKEVKAPIPPKIKKEETITCCLDLNILQRKKLSEVKLRSTIEELDFAGQSQEDITKILKNYTEESKKVFLNKSLDSNTIRTNDLRKYEIKEEINNTQELNKQLEGLCVQYKMPFSEVCNLHGQVSGSIADLEKCLKGEKVSLWNGLEDMALTLSKDEAIYKQLVKVKGEREIAKRKLFLNIA